jgi:hypothetical protein
MRGLSPEDARSVIAIERACSALSFMGCCFVLITFAVSDAFRQRAVNRLVFLATFGNLMTNVRSPPELLSPFFFLFFFSLTPNFPKTDSETGGHIDDNILCLEPSLCWLPGTSNVNPGVVASAVLLRQAFAHSLTGLCKVTRTGPWPWPSTST